MSTGTTPETLAELAALGVDRLVVTCLQPDLEAAEGRDGPGSRDRRPGPRPADVPPTEPPPASGDRGVGSARSSQRRAHRSDPSTPARSPGATHRPGRCAGRRRPPEAGGGGDPSPAQRRLSARYDASVYLKREDLQAVRSYKIRGAFNFIAGLPPSGWPPAWSAPAPATTPRGWPGAAAIWPFPVSSSCPGAPPDRR